MNRVAESLATGVEVTVGAATLPEADFRHETQLLRVGLLYGDRVTLFSLMADIIEKGESLAALNEGELIELTITDSLRSTGPTAGHAQIEETLREYQRLKRRRRKTRDEILFVERHRERLARLQREMAAHIPQVLTRRGVTQLRELLESGLVTLKTVDSGMPGEVRENAVQEYLDLLVTHLQERRSHPLLDDTTSSLVRHGLSSGQLVLTRPSIERSKSVAVAADFLLRVPTLEELTVADIISIREELRVPLLRFRAAVGNFSRQIEHEPWTQEFAVNVQELFDQNVVPALVDIGDEVQANRLLSKLLHAASARPLTIPATSAIGMLAASASAASDLLIQGLSSLVGAGLVANEAIEGWRHERRNIERNQLFFLYELARRT